MTGFHDEKVKDRLEIDFEVPSVEKGNECGDVFEPGLKLGSFEFNGGFFVFVEIENHEENGLFEGERSRIVEGADDFWDDGLVVLFEESPYNPVHDLKGVIVSKFGKSFSELFFVIVREVVDDDVLFDFEEFESFGHVRIMV